MKIDISDADFEEKVLKKSEKIPVVVDFWAPWCPPCNVLGPVLDKVSGDKEYDGKFILAKLNVQENEERSKEYGVMGIPAVKMFKSGKVVAEFIGAKPEEKVREWLNENLK